MQCNYITVELGLHSRIQSICNQLDSLSWILWFLLRWLFFFIEHITEFYVCLNKTFLLWDGEKHSWSPFNLSTIVDLLNSVGAHMLLLIGALSLSVRILGFSLELVPLCFFFGEERISGISLPHFLDMAQRRWLPTDNNSRENAPPLPPSRHQAAELEIIPPPTDGLTHISHAPSTQLEQKSFCANVHFSMPLLSVWSLSPLWKLYFHSADVHHTYWCIQPFFFCSQFIFFHLFFFFFYQNTCTIFDKN